MKNSFENVKKRYQELKAEREKYVPRWEEISRYVGIRVQPQAYPAAGESNKSRDLDKYTEDPDGRLVGAAGVRLSEGNHVGKRRWRHLD